MVWGGRNRVEGLLQAHTFFPFFLLLFLPVSFEQTSSAKRSRGRLSP